MDKFIIRVSKDQDQFKASSAELGISGQGEDAHEALLKFIMEYEEGLAFGIFSSR